MKGSLDGLGMCSGWSYELLSGEYTSAERDGINKKTIKYLRWVMSNARIKYKSV